MRIHQIQRHEIDTKALVQRAVLEKDYDIVFDEPVTLMMDGRPIVVYEEYGKDVQDFLPALNAIRYTVGFRTGGLKTLSRTIGFFPRIAMRQDYCVPSMVSTETPEAHAKIVELGQLMATEYERLLPDMYAAHYAEVSEKVLPDWRLPGTPWTSGIVNKNNPLKYHFDAGNFKGYASAMSVFRRGVEGGMLVLPEFRIAINLRHRSLIIFDGSKLLHGVSPITKKSPDAFRFSIVFYSLKGMCKCLDLDGEDQRIRIVKTQRERDRAKGRDYAEAKMNGKIK